MTEDGLLIRSRADLDLLLLNLEAAVKVGKRSDFFSWVQGVFQGIIGHEILLCLVVESNAQDYRAAWMSSAPVAEDRLAQLCDRRGGLAHRLMGMWEQMGRRPLLLPPHGRNAPGEVGVLAELERLGLDNVLAHGVPDVNGHAAGFYSFSKLRQPVTERELVGLDIMVAQVHAAWVRVCCAERYGRAAASPSPREILTGREIEILQWVEQGKSNNEIAQILQISHLTVKNHVQKILRKLDVQNRAQAVAKGINLNLTSGR